MNSKVDDYLKNAKRWREEMTRLRAIVLSCDLTEELKWGKPCYTVDGKNVVLIIGFKEYCSLLLGKGALLKDPKGILVKAGENTQSARQIRFTSLGQIVDLEPALKAYIREAVEVEKAGLEVVYKPISERPIPGELQRKWEEMPDLKTAFKALTPGRQRAYLMHFSEPKQAKTRESRIEKCIPQILQGKGLNEEYRSAKK
jgi:uncharacterized protein YdeI (YjbR/CyaY-like superfamily)